MIFLEMSFFEWVEMEREKVDVVFCSPPWGGPGYRIWKVFDVERMKPYGFGKVWEGAMKAIRGPGTSSTPANTTTMTTATIGIAKAAFYMPRTSDLNQLAMYVDGLNPAGGLRSEKGKEKWKVKKLGAMAEVIHYTLSGKSKAVCFYVNVPITAPMVEGSKDMMN